MAGTVHVTLAGPAVSSGLVSVFSARGLAVAVSEGGECCELEVSYAADPDERLRSDVMGALRDWLAEAHTPLVLSEAGDRGYVLRPAGE